MKFEESDTKSYLKQIMEAVQYLHKQDPPIIHRDLKPENVFVKNNNVKIADFGWSNFSGARQTYCGTIDYIPPEMIKNEMHDEKVDIWSLGVLFYEVLYGYVPFRINFKQGNIQLQTKIIEKNILNGNIEYKNDISQEAIDVLKKMLEPDPSKRYNAESVLSSPFFSSVIKINQTQNPQDFQKQFENEKHMNQKFVDLIKK